MANETVETAGTEQKVEGIGNLFDIGKKVIELVKMVQEYKDKIDDLEKRVKALEEK